MCVEDKIIQTICTNLSSVFAKTLENESFENIVVSNDFEQIRQALKKNGIEITDREIFEKVLRGYTDQLRLI